MRTCQWQPLNPSLMTYQSSIERRARDTNGHQDLDHPGRCSLLRPLSYQLAVRIYAPDDGLLLHRLSNVLRSELLLQHPHPLFLHLRIQRYAIRVRTRPRKWMWCRGKCIDGVRVRKVRWKGAGRICWVEERCTRVFLGKR